MAFYYSIPLLFLLLHPHPLSAGPLSSRIVNGLKLKYPQVSDISRVLTCWENFENGKKLDRFVDGNQEIKQEADCFVDNLTSTVNTYCILLLYFLLNTVSIELYSGVLSR